MTNLHIILTIQETVEDYFTLPRWSTDDKTRKTGIKEARFIIMYLANKLTDNLTNAALGAMIGQRDHSTVFHAIKTVEDLMSIDAKFKDDVFQIEELVKDKKHDINHVLSDS